MVVNRFKNANQKLLALSRVKNGTAVAPQAEKVEKLHL